MSVELDSRVKSAETAMSTMLIYYHQSLVEAGCSDPKKQIATIVSNVISISESQMQYIENTPQGASITETFDNIFTLLELMVSTDKVDKESISLITNSLRTISSVAKMKPYKVKEEE